MARRKGHTPESEIVEAVKRIGKNPEARKNAKNSQLFQDFLIDVIGINPNSVASDAGQKFWLNDVREGVSGKETKLRQSDIYKPSDRQLIEANVHRQVNSKTGQVNYRGNSSGRFVSVKNITQNMVVDL